MCASVHADERFGGLHAVKRDMPVNTEPPRQLLDRSAERVFTGDVEVNVRNAIQHVTKRLEQRRLILHPIETCRVEQAPRRAGGLVCRRERRRVDANWNDDRLDGMRAGQATHVFRADRHL